MDQDERAPRDLLAERLRRLEKAVAAVAEQVAETTTKLDAATDTLATLVDLVGRLGHVVDAQGTTLHVDEGELASRVGGVERDVSQLSRELGALLARFETLSRAVHGSGSVAAAPVSTIGQAGAGRPRS